jgi:hypothetical protein
MINVRNHLVNIIFELSKLDLSVDGIVMSEEWHDRLNQEAVRPLQENDTFYEKKYLVKPDLPVPYFMIISPKEAYSGDAV